MRESSSRTSKRWSNHLVTESHSSTPAAQSIVDWRWVITIALSCCCCSAERRLGFFWCQFGLTSSLSPPLRYLFMSVSVSQRQPTSVLQAWVRLAALGQQFDVLSMAHESLPMPIVEFRHSSASKRALSCTACVRFNTFLFTSWSYSGKGKYVPGWMLWKSCLLPYQSLQEGAYRL